MHSSLLNAGGKIWLVLANKTNKQKKGLESEEKLSLEPGALAD